MWQGGIQVSQPFPLCRLHAPVTSVYIVQVSGALSEQPHTEASDEPGDSHLDTAAESSNASKADSQSVYQERAADVTDMAWGQDAVGSLVGEMPARGLQEGPHTMQEHGSASREDTAEPRAHVGDGIERSEGGKSESAESTPTGHADALHLSAEPSYSDITAMLGTSMGLAEPDDSDSAAVEMDTPEQRGNDKGPAGAGLTEEETDAIQRALNRDKQGTPPEQEMDVSARLTQERGESLHKGNVQDVPTTLDSPALSESDIAQHLPPEMPNVNGSEASSPPQLDSAAEAAQVDSPPQAGQPGAGYDAAHLTAQASPQLRKIQEDGSEHGHPPHKPGYEDAPQELCGYLDSQVLGDILRKNSGSAAAAQLSGDDSPGALSPRDHSSLTDANLLEVGRSFGPFLACMQGFSVILLDMGVSWSVGSLHDRGEYAGCKGEELHSTCLEVCMSAFPPLEPAMPLTRTCIIAIMLGLM